MEANGMTDREQKILSYSEKKGRITKLEADQLLASNSISELNSLTQAGLLTKELPGLYKPVKTEQLKMF